MLNRNVPDPIPPTIFIIQRLGRGREGEGEGEGENWNWNWWTHCTKNGRGHNDEGYVGKFSAQSFVIQKCKLGHTNFGGIKKRTSKGTM